MANVGNVVGKVAVLEGQAFARGADGKMRALKLGDVVYEGEVIVTATNSHVELAFEGGKTYLVREQETVTLDKTVFGTDLPDSRDAALLDSAKTTDDIARAIAEGGSLDELLEETALTLAGGAADDGHGFVELMRIVETVPPAGYDYGTDGVNPTAELVGGSALNNAPPEAVDDTVTTDEDTPINIAVRGNDSDPESDVLTVSAVTDGAHGTVAIDPVSGNPVYTPNRNWNGTDTFTYTIDDGHGGTATATVTVTVNAVNDTPVAGTIDVTPDGTTTADPNSVGAGNYLHTIPEDTSASGQVQATDVDGDVLVYSQASNPAHGSVVVNPDGSYTYTPNANYNGNDSFTVLVSDGHGGTTTSTVSIVITPVQDASIITPGSGSVTEDAVLSTSGRLTITDVDGPQDERFTPQSNVAGAHGTFSIDVNGNWTYNLNNGDPAVQALNAGQSMTEVFNVTGVDGTPSTVTVVINGVNENAAPGAQNDAATTVQDVPVTINVLGNDADPDGDPLSISGFGQGANGTVTLVAGQLVYTPSSGFVGTDTFTYSVNDGKGGTDSATVTIAVGVGIPVNQPPVANADTATTAASTPVTIAVLANDTDPENDSLVVTAASVPAAQGTVVVNGDNTVTFTPAAGFTGNATISYTISDGTGTSNSTVTVGVAAPVNQPPVANPDTATTGAVTPVTIAVLANDTDPEGDTLSVTAASVPAAHGTVVVNGDNTVTFTPAAGFTGNATISYTISDGTGTSNSTVTVGVAAPVNQAPDAINDGPLAATEDTALTITPVTLLGNDTDPDGNPLTITSVQGAVNGTVALVGGNVVFTPAPGYNGQASFTYTISDGQGGSDTATVTLNVGAVNDAPDAIDDGILAATEDTALTITPVTLLGNDTDPDGNPLSINSVQGAVNGTVALVGGNVVFTPAPGYNGQASFTYTISDGQGGSDTATVTLNVGAVNDAPDAIDDGILAATEDTALTITPVTLLGNDTDPDGNPLTITSVQGAVNGTVALVGGNVVFTPAPGYNGQASFTYTISDGQGGSDTATVTLNVGAVNDRPDAVNDGPLAATEDTALTITPVTLLGNDTDPDGNPLSITSVQGAVNGTVALVGGNVVFTPAPGYNGQASFTYTISDGQGGSDTATVTLNVGAVNDRPDAVNDGPLAATEDTALTIVPATLLGNDTDPDGNPLTISSVQGAVNGTVALVGGNVVFTPAPGYNGQASFTYTISDGAGGSDTATVTLNVGAVNDAPDAVDDGILAATEDVALTITPLTLLGNDTDPDGNPLSINSVQGAVNGTVALVGGNVVFTPAPGYNGQASFTYTISDGQGGSDTATVTLNVGAVNDAPDAVDDGILAATEDTALTIVPATLLGNDTDPDGNPLTITSVQGATNGTVALVGGNVVFTPAPGYNGQASFTYTISDGQGGSDTATVTLNVGAVNDAPVAQDDTGSVNENATLTVTAADGVIQSNGALGGRDTDQDGDTLLVSAVRTGPEAGTGTAGTVGGALTGTYGTLTLAQDGGYSYVADLNAADLLAPGATANDVFTYTISDGHGGTDVAQLTIVITGTDDACTITGIGNATGDQTVFENDLLAGSSPDAAALTKTGSFTIQALDGIATVQVGGTTLTSAQLQALGTTPVTVNTPYGELTLNGYVGNAQGGTVSYSYVLQTNVDNDSQGGATVSGYVEPVTVTVTDADGDAKVGSLNINIVDDSPLAASATHNIYVGVDAISVNDLKAGWTGYRNTSGGTNGLSPSNTDADAYNDKIDWGTASGGSGRSGYVLVDASAYTSSAGTAVQAGQSFKLADFTHNNFPITGTVLDYTDLIMTMDVVINGVSTPVSFTVRVDHNETSNSNDPIASRDIITLPAQTITLNINGQHYNINLDGFKDSSGAIVHTIYTNEGVANSFGIYGSITTTEALPSLAGNVFAETGADGSVSHIVWGGTASSYGTFVGNADGSYSFVMNEATRSSLQTGQSLTASFNYSITDNDGDVANGAVNIQLGGYQDIEGTSSANTLTGTAANDMLSGFAGNDSLNGGAGSDVLIGGAGSDTLDGGVGSDVLRWTLGDTGSDTVNNFGSAAGTDVLDLRDLLVGESHLGTNAGTLANYLHFTTDGTNTTVSVNADATGGVEQTIVLNNVNLVGAFSSDQQIIQDLLTKGKLITD